MPVTSLIPAVISVALTVLATVSHPAPSNTDIEWQNSLEAALTKAEDQDRPLLLYFWVDGSAFCQQMYADTLTTEPGVAELANYVCLSVPADRTDSADLLKRYGVSTLPTLVFGGVTGEPEDAIKGFMPLEGFLSKSRRIRRGEGTVSHWREQVAGTPDDLDLRMRLALQLEHVGSAVESAELIESIKQADPQGKTLAGAQLLLYDIFALVRNSATDPSDARTYDLTPLYAHMPKVTPIPSLYEGWQWIADVEQQHGNRVEERIALTKMWTHAPDESARLNSGYTLQRRFFLMESELSQRERKFSMRVAAHITEIAKARPDFVTTAFVHHSNAVALAVNGDRKQALLEAEKAVELDPTNSALQSLRDLLKPTAN